MPLWCKDLMNETEKLQFMNLNSLLNFFLYPKLFLSIILRALFLENLPSHEISSFLRTKLSVALFCFLYCHDLCLLQSFLDTNLEEAIEIFFPGNILSFQIICVTPL